ncbi:MAG: D-Ala-D-Ala carboxypeptidase family metallohydrolase [Pseudomonadota bacterium]
MIRILLVFALAAILASCSVVSNPSSEAAFELWLQKEDGRQETYQRFAQLISDAGASDIVPTWQLLRVDADYVWRCDSAYFDFPPEEKWAAIIPTLKLVRDEVIPVVGAVEVASAHRSTTINACVGGASQSKHLQFTALDLVPVKSGEKREHFKALCEMHSGLGTRSRMGLGAYFDPDNPSKNANGRFHIDSSGYRRWGYDYTGKSDPCPLLLRG